MTANTPITLTSDQVIALVGHGVTQEQLDSTRRELSEQIERNRTELNTKIDAVEKELSDKIDAVEKGLQGKIDSLGAKIDKRTGVILMFLLGNMAAIVALAFWLGQKLPG